VPKRFDSAFLAARERHRVFARFESPAALVAALPLSDTLTHEEKHVITRAMLDEAARGDDAARTWTSLLVVAYAPMLKPLVRKAAARQLDDRTQTVLLAFTEAVHSAAKAAPTDSAPGYLKRATLLGLAQKTKRDRREPEAEAFDDEATVTSSRAVFDRPLDEIADLRAVVERARQGNTRDVATLASFASRKTDLPVTQLVAALNPNATDVELRALYKRVLRQRTPRPGVDESAGAP
jgi:hypothetical protein